MEEKVLFKTDFGDVISYKDEDELDICFRTEKGDIIDLFLIKFGNGCLNEFLFGDVFNEDYTETCTIKEDDINEACLYD